MLAMARVLTLRHSVRSLLRKGANVHVRDRNNSTPFQLALKGGYFEVTQLLQRYGAETNCAGMNHGSPYGVQPRLTPQVTATG